MRKKTRSKSKETQLKIERQELIGEVQIKSYEVVRLSRIKYIGNDYNFIDIRMYQRGYSEHSVEDVYYPTKRGAQLREDLFLKLVDAHFVEGIEKRMKGPSA
jgi:hypothetical protein